MCALFYFWKLAYVLKESRNTRTASNIIWYWNWESEGLPIALTRPAIASGVMTHHSAHSSRFLHPEGLHHLEHIHHSFCLAPLNGGGYGTEHTTAAHHVTTGKTPPHSHTAHTHDRATAYLQCITMGWLPVLLWTLATSSITSVTVLRLEQLPSEAQLVMWNWLT